MVWLALPIGLVALAFRQKRARGQVSSWFVFVLSVGALGLAVAAALFAPFVVFALAGRNPWGADVTPRFVCAETGG
jgi:hypothetical protein